MFSNNLILCYFRISTNCAVVSLSKAPFVTKLTLPSDKLTLKSVDASVPVDVPRISIELGRFSTFDVTVTAEPVATSSEILVVSESADHAGAV